MLKSSRVSMVPVVADGVGLLIPNRRVLSAAGGEHHGVLCAKSAETINGKGEGIERTSRRMNFRNLDLYHARPVGCVPPSVMSSQVVWRFQRSNSLPVAARRYGASYR